MKEDITSNEIENLESFSSDDETILSADEVELAINEGSAMEEALSTNPVIAVARAGKNKYGLWGYICVRNGDKYKVIGNTLEPGQPVPYKGHIPAGTYRFKRWDSPKLKKTLRLFSVPNFTNVLVHVGNTQDDTRGCILAAKSVDNNKTPRRLVNSRVMTDYLYNEFADGQILVGWV